MPEPPVDESAPKSGRNLPQAIATALVLLGLLLGAMAVGPTAFFWLATLVVTAATVELFIAVREAGHKTITVMAPVGTLGLMVPAYFWPGEPGYLVVAVAAIMVVSFLLALRPQRGPTPATDVRVHRHGPHLDRGWGSRTVSMLTLTSGVSILVAHVLIAAVDDIGAFFIGTSFGKHKMAPSVSPAKSWEGLIGGFVAALIAGAGFGYYIDVIGTTHGVVMGAIIGALAPAGDLAESMFKRELGIKDSGRMLPGHGGMLDRLDAIMFSAPAVFLYLRFVVF